MNFIRQKTIRSALALPQLYNGTNSLILLENVVKVTNLEMVKIEFGLPFLISSASLAP